MKISITIPILNHRFQFYFSHYSISNIRTIGIYDICMDGSHILFMDYDKFRLDWLEQELKKFQNEYKLSDFIILQSSETSFHAICFDKLIPSKHNQIIQLSNCDEAFRNAIRWDIGARVLRVSPKGRTEKPKYIKTIKSKYNIHKKSKPHIKFFQFNYDIPKINHKNSDLESKSTLDDGKVYIINYPTKKNV